MAERKISHILKIGLCISFTAALVGCKASTSGSRLGGNRDKTYFFDRDSDFQPVKRSGVGSATQLIVGNFTDDSYPDLIVLTTSSGMVFYRNEEGTGFSAGSPISATFQNNSAGIAYGKDVIVAESGTGTVRYLDNTNNDGSFSMTSGHSLVTGSVVSQLGVIDTYLVVMNAIQPIVTTIGASSFTNSGTINVFPAATAYVHSSALNSDVYEDFLFVAESGSQTPIVYRGTASGPASTTLTWTRAQSDDVSEFAFGNLTGTTATDIVLVTDDDLELMENQSTSAFSFATEGDFNIDVVGHKVLVHDFLLSDGQVDIYVTRNDSTGKLYKNEDAAEFVFEDITDTTGFGTGDLGSDPVDVVKADFDGDTLMDIAELYSDSSIRIYMNTAKTE